MVKVASSVPKLAIFAQVEVAVRTPVDDVFGRQFSPTKEAVSLPKGEYVAGPQPFKSMNVSGR